MSSREQIKVKRLSPTPEELRKSMKEASKEVAMWDFELEWKDSILTDNSIQAVAEYKNITTVIINKKKKSESTDILIENKFKSNKRCKYINVNLSVPTTDIDRAKHIAENIVRSIVCGTQGIAESSPEGPAIRIKKNKERYNEIL